MLLSTGERKQPPSSPTRSVWTKTERIVQLLPYTHFFITEEERRFETSSQLELVRSIGTAPADIHFCFAPGKVGL